MIDRVGSYEVIREIGRGGMGVVYLARDSRLDREVAIKALPEHLAADPARLERFDREAKTLAGLSHPNIAGIYGVEEHDGARYLALEYVGGETLADRLDRGPLPVDEAVEYAVQIAAGVEAAHEAGVIHRDLKPANIKITPDGVAKVLDFGLARVEEASSSTGALDSPTMTSPQPQHSPTIEGAILGTAAYMSPEQARGRRVDKRTDIWSFGVILLEMLTGSSPFHGETATDTIGAVLHKAFPIDLPESTPWMVRRMLRRCLERDKTRRLQSIGDVRVELQDALGRIEAGDPDETIPGRTAARSKVWPVLTVCFAITALVGLTLWLTKPAPFSNADAVGDRPMASTATPSVVSVEQLTDFSLGVWGVTLSSDATTVAYGAWDTGQNSDVYSLRVGGANQLDLTQSPGTSDVLPAFSPNGESIAYLSLPDNASQGGLYVMGATGENPRRIAEFPCWEPAWSPDGTQLAYTSELLNGVYDRLHPSALWIVDVTTQEKRLVDTNRAPPGEEANPWHRDASTPSWSPDGSRIAFWGTAKGTRDIFTVSAEGGDVIRITDDLPTDWNPIWSPDGNAIWFLSDRGGNAGLWSVSLDSDGRPAGEPRPIMLGPGEVTSVSRAADGSSIVALVTTSVQRVERVRFDPRTELFSGASETVIESTRAMNAPVISQDGEWLAFHSAAPQEDVTVMRLDGTGRRRLTHGIAKDRFPSWAPDSKTLYYQSNRTGNYQVWTVNRESAETSMLPIEDTNHALAPCVSPDGMMLAFNITGEPIQIARLDEEGSVTDVHASPAGFSISDSSFWSPDNRRFIGVQDNPGGAPIGVVLDTQTNTLLEVRKPNGDHIFYETNVRWIDATRLLAQHGDAEAAFVFDIETGDSRWVENSPTGLGRFIALQPDGWLFTLRNEEVSNLWLVTLDLAGGA